MVTTFSKDTHRVEDVYTLRIAPYYKADVFCATWMLGTSQPLAWPRMASAAGRHKAPPIPRRAALYAAFRATSYPPPVRRGFARACMPGNGNPRPDVCRGQGNPYSIRNLASFTVAGVVQQSELDHSKLALIPARGVFCLGDIKWV